MELHPLANIELAAKKHADDFRENITEFKHDFNIETWVNIQAKINWEYKGSPTEQRCDEQDCDFHLANQQFRYLLAANILQHFPQQECLLRHYTVPYHKYLQGITIQQFLEMQAYFNWVDRTERREISTAEQWREDYLSACQSLRHALYHCIRCPHGSSRDQWSALSSSDLRLGLDSSIVQMITAHHTVLCIDYVRFFTTFRRNMEAFFAGDPIPWEELTFLLEYLWQAPYAISMFQMLVIRALTADHFTRLYRQLLEDGNGLHDITKKLAWLFWYSKGSPDQWDLEARDQDYDVARQDLAYTLADMLTGVYDAQAFQRIMANKALAQLLASVFYSSYKQHREAKARGHYRVISAQPYSPPAARLHLHERSFIEAPSSLLLPPSTETVLDFLVRHLGDGVSTNAA